MDLQTVMTPCEPLPSQTTSGSGKVRLCNSAEDYLAWDRFLYDFPGAHFFQTYGWLRSYEPMGLTPHLLIYEQDGAITGGVAFLSAKIPLIPFRIFIIPHGPLPANPDAPGWSPLMQRLDDICQKDNAVYAQVYPHESSSEQVLLPRLKTMGFTSPALFTAHQFSTEPVTVDLVGKSEEEVLASIRERTRTYIRRALKSKFELRTELNHLTFDKVYRLFEDHGESRGFRPRPYVSLRSAWEWFSQRGWATLIQAWRGDTLVGANLLIFTGRTAYYIHGAVDRAFAEQRPAEFIHWHSIRTAIQLGLEKYDLVNLGPPGVEQFKRGFRPQHHPWHHPRTKIYRPSIAKMIGAADQYFRPLLRGVGRFRAKAAN
jgi:lipid II:glycine glycyltransferase (peptidoglycan interpeptide bridge formation enzyme)